MTTKPSVALSAPATFVSRVVAKVEKIDPVTVKAIGPGEISGPGLAITVTIANGTAAAIDLNNTIVDLTGSDGAPTVPITSADKPITGVLAPGKSATGTYQFKIPEALRDPVTIAVSYSTSAAVVVFNGSAR